MTELLLALLIVAILGVALFLYVKLGKTRADTSVLALLNENFNARMSQIADQFNKQTQQLNLRLKENNEILHTSHKHIGERLDSAAKVVGAVTDRLGKMEEANKRIYDIGKDISSLQDILKAPKLRGGLGEFFLADLLAQYFPREKFSMPYTFRSGEKVDAALHLADERIVPIDSKFPLENFKKMIETGDPREKKIAAKAFASDVKKRIDEIARYIVPDEGTMDFALLYIPAENVYYEVIVKDEESDGLCTYAFKKRVIPVSPNNFFVYLQTILMGLRGLQIERSAQDIQAGLVRLKGDFERFSEEFDVLGSHLTNANNKYDDARRRFDKIGIKLDSITALNQPEAVKELPQERVAQ